MKRRRVLVCGGRDYRDASRVLREIAAECSGVREAVIVHGAAQGADTLAAKAAAELVGLSDEPHPADWKAHGRSAGPIRNAEMLASGIDYALVFPGGRGTRDMMLRLFEAGVPFRFVGQQPEEE